jgi:hypothetical protein
MWRDGPEEDIERVHLPLPERFSQEPERFVHPTMDPRGTQIVAVAARSRLIQIRPRNRLLGTVRYFFRYRTALGYLWLGVGMPVLGSRPMNACVSTAMGPLHHASPLDHHAG